MSMKSIPQFYIIRGIYFFIFLIQKKIDCGYSLELHLQDGSNVYLQPISVYCMREFS